MFETKHNGRRFISRLRNLETCQVRTFQNRKRPKRRPHDDYLGTVKRTLRQHFEPEDRHQFTIQLGLCRRKFKHSSFFDTVPVDYPSKDLRRNLVLRCRPLQKGKGMVHNNINVVMYDILAFAVPKQTYVWRMQDNYGGSCRRASFLRENWLWPLDTVYNLGVLYCHAYTQSRRELEATLLPPMISRWGIRRVIKPRLELQMKQVAKSKVKAKQRYVRLYRRFRRRRIYKCLRGQKRLNHQGS